MTRFIKSAFVAVVGAALAIGVAGTAPAQAASLKQQIVGSWSYVSVENTKSDGSRAKPFGDKPSGIAIFERNGHFAFVLTRAGVAKFASSNRATGTPDENQAAVRGTLAQFGTYTVNPADHSLTLHIAGASYPNIVGTDRKFIITTVTKTELKWAVPAATSGGSASVALQRIP